MTKACDLPPQPGDSKLVGNGVTFGELFGRKKMVSKLAVVDATYLCHVALHSTGHLTNGVVFGFLGQVETLHTRFADHDFVFCFDSPKNLRKKLDKRYKANRPIKSEKQAEEFNQQRNSLQHEVLPSLGCATYCVEGYEADDCIAKVVTDGIRGYKGYTMVSGDEDLYQLLAPNVRQYAPAKKDPNKRMTLVGPWLSDTGLREPKQWVMVKAIAGCTSDNVIGVQDIGPVRAIQYLRGTLPQKYVAAIASETELIANNVKLVKLPFDGMPTEKVKPSGIPDQHLWNKVMEECGMPSRARGIKRRK